MADSGLLYFLPDPHQDGSLRPVFGVMADFSGDQMRCRKTDEFTGRNDFGLLPELRKMLLLPVIR